MRILTVVGARPQFIKASVVSKALKPYETIDEILVHTGQHYDYKMSKVFFEELSLSEPTHHLQVGSGDHGVQTGMMMQRLEPVVKAESPDTMMVYGDTNSTLAAALVASKLGIPLFHVEAGLRSFDKSMPEEVNRILTDHVSTLLFSPSTLAVSHLVNENICASQIRLVGDVMFDSALAYLNNERVKDLEAMFNIMSKNYVLVTIHRQENTASRTVLKDILSSVNKMASICPVLFPLHPRTRNMLSVHDLHLGMFPDVHFVEPLGYIDMLALEKHARMVVTDSGGVQKESFFFKVPCIVVRKETEWVEIIDAGAAAYAAPDNIMEVAQTFSYTEPEKKYFDAFGGGKAANRIAEEIVTFSGSR